MKYAFIILLCAPLILFAETVKVTIEHNPSKKGNILIAVFNDPGEFPDRKSISRNIIPTEVDGSSTINLDLAQGEYAISVFLDENHNNKLDTNILGIPKELFGFSNNPRILTGPPSFQECEISIDRNNKEFKIKLIKLI
jgi:uncharacterized protein (DUF2141 family)